MVVGGVVVDVVGEGVVVTFSVVLRMVVLSGVVLGSSLDVTDFRVDWRTDSGGKE